MFRNESALGANILTLYPGPVTLYPSGLKWVCIFLFYVLSVGCSALLLWPSLHQLAGQALLHLAGVVAVPVVLLVLIVAITYGRGRPRLTLDAEGIELLHPLWGCRRLHWSEITRFRSYLGLAFRVDVSPPKGSWDRFRRTYLCADHRIWTDTFGLDAKDFARLMNAWRERAMTSRP
jgi:hypothetical protein